MSLDCTSIVENIRSDVPQGIEDLYLMVHGMDRLYSYLISRVGLADAEDGMQDVVLQTVVTIRKGGLRDAKSLPGMIRTIAKRWAFSQIRPQARFLHTVFLDEIPALCDVEAELAGRERRATAVEVLCCMTYRDRDVLRRFYLQEQPRWQICTELGLTETQFRLLKSRAKLRFVDLSRRLISGRQST